MTNDVSTTRLSRRGLVIGGASGLGAAALLGPLDVARAARRYAGSKPTLNLATSAGALTTYAGLADDFKKQTGITLNVIGFPENALYDKIQLDIASGARRFDLALTGAGGAKQFGLAGHLLPLPRPKDIGDFFTAAIQQYSIGGKLFGYPTTTDTNLYYWRTDLAKKAGLDATRPPATLDEFRRHAIALTVDTKGRHPDDRNFDQSSVAVYGANYKGSASLACTWEWYNYLFAYGGDVLRNGDYTVTVDQPAAVAALQWVVDNYRTYKIYPQGVPTFDYTEFHTLFYAGKVATCLNWPYMYAAAQDPKLSKVAGKVAVGLRPGKATHGGELGGWSIGALSQTRYPEEAIAAATFFSSPRAVHLYATRGQTPARRSAFKELTAQQPALYRAISDNLAHGRGLNLLATGPSWPACEKILAQAVQQALIGQASPKDALSAARSSITGILRRNRFYEQVRKVG